MCDFNIVNGQKIPDSEVWGVNGAYTTPNVMPDKLKSFFSMDKLFITDHLFSRETGTLNFDINSINEFAHKHNCEVITMRPFKLGKYSLERKTYPYKEIVKSFQCDYFTDTVCYMIAYALYKYSYMAINPNGVVRREIKYPLSLRLFGIDMCTSREYQQSKGGVEHWLGIARGMGVAIEIAKGSSIFANPLGAPYGKKFKIKLKDYDPFGLLRGKYPSTADIDKAIAEAEAREQRTTSQGPGYISEQPLCNS